MPDIERRFVIDLPIEAAKAKAVGLLDDLAKPWGLNAEWTGATATFKGSGAKGVLKLEAKGEGQTQGAIEIGLNMLVRAFKGKIASEVDSGLDKIGAERVAGQ
ncbi:polyhydroxyalkanoic acid system family protein [Aeromicrobium sp. NPDC092404]|uniref:polyhydroxyalkanoic acid system family protein n=1 Tax=Aeromicrobium sp. NPDC092404 TaxID=3154976 RepID=UPI003413912D